MKNKLNISVIGIGHLGNIHSKVLKLNEDVNFIGVYDIIPERTLKAAEDYGCKSFNTLEECIKGSDALLIAVPTSIHYEVAEICLKEGKHCFIEKPITDSVHSAYKLIDLADKMNLKLQIGHIERFNPALKALNEFKLNPIFIEAHRLGQFKPRARDVSVIHDLMIHDIDIALQLVNSKIKKIDANGVNVLSETTDIANARLTFENGAVANLTASRISANLMRKMRLFQKDAYISIDFNEHTVEVFNILDSEKTQSAKLATMLGSIDTGSTNRNIYYIKPEVKKINAIEEEQKSFFNSIIENTKVLVDAKSATEALRVAEVILNEIEKNKFEM